MIRKLSLAAGLAVAVGFALNAPSASAVTVGPHTAIPTEAATDALLLQQAQWGPHCRRVARLCAHRWGWGTWRFRRCLRRRGC